MLFEAFVYRKPTEYQVQRGRMLEQLLLTMDPFDADSYDHAMNIVISRCVKKYIPVHRPMIHVKVVCLDPPKQEFACPGTISAFFYSGSGSFA